MCRKLTKETEMKEITRREVFGMAATGLIRLTSGGLTAAILHPEFACADVGWASAHQEGDGGASPSLPRIPVLHATDLFRPHIDPDDHWDLACVYALAYRGDIDLKGILIDYPPRAGENHNPDIMAVAQMNLITGLFVPVAVGSALPMKSRNDIQPGVSSTDHQGVRMVLDVLEKSPQPVVINILGSSRDVAIAGKKRPDLFASKCAAVYLNAGTARQPDGGLASKLEYNVTLDKYAYAAIFDLPCPVYWMPCFEQVESGQQRSVSEYGTHYRFRQNQILPHLSDMVQNYFAYMFGRYTDHNWLLYVKGKKDEALLRRFASQDRDMWCTAGFLHAAGYTASRDGNIVPLSARGCLTANQATDLPIFHPPDVRRVNF